MTGFLALDIETASRPSWLGRRALVECPEPKDRPAWMLEHAADAAIDPMGGGMLVAVALYGQGIDFCRVVAAESGERAALVDLQAQLVGFKGPIVAHGGHDFDFPFVRARALAHSLPNLGKRLYQAKPWDGKLIDTTSPDWCPRPVRSRQGWSYSLNALAETIGIVRPPTTPGAEVPAAWYRGELDSIRSHVLDDVRTLALVFERLREASCA